MPRWAESGDGTRRRPRPASGDRHFAVGDRITARAPNRDLHVDGIGPIDIPRSFFDHHRTPAGRPEVGIDHAYALTSYAVQGSTRDISTSRVDATATRAETYVDITRGRHANHHYLTAAVDPLDGEALPRVPPAPADLTVAERLHRTTGKLTAWGPAHPTDQEQSVPDQAVGI